MKELETQKIIDSVNIPAIVLNQEGKVVFANDKISDVFIYSSVEDLDVFQLTGLKFNEIIDEDKVKDIERNDKTFRIHAFRSSEDRYVIYFNDITSFAELKEVYNNQRPCAIKIQIDNYDELINPIGEDPNLELASDIDKIVRAWFSKYSATINRVNNNSYTAWVEQMHLKEMIDAKFNLLDEVRELETGVDFSASLSIGIGLSGKNFLELEDFSEDALELALGRGGDQAVIKRGQKIEYFGGTLQTYQKNNKQKSRMVGHALLTLIKESKNVLIMGHKYADLDSLGACLGINRLVDESEKEAYIVIDEISDSLEKIYDKVRVDDNYHFISSKRALEIATEDSLVVVVDTNRPNMVQCPSLISKCEKIVVIDHHRMVEDSFDEVALSYVETYESSASEMVSEILSIMLNKKKSLRKIEAEALLSGMMIDTDDFTMKTGVRTFEAAAWLRRQGADPTEVKRYFQEDFESIKLKALSILKAQIYPGGIAITSLDKVMPNAQVLCAQIADQLLTLEGVNASFSVGRNSSSTVISARSLGDINVQLIMEELGGGGHLSVAAAQVDLGIDEAIWKILEIMKIEKEGN